MEGIHIRMAPKELDCPFVASQGKYKNGKRK